MDVKLIVAIIGLLVGISGWVTFFYNYIIHKPKINGRIFQPVVGKFSINQKGGKQRELTSFLVYLYLTTNRRTPVRVLEYKMEVTFTDGTTHKLERVFGSTVENLTFKWINDAVINPRLSENLIYKKQTPIEQKDPLHGFVLFAGTEELYSRNIEKIIITVVDVFGNNHQISESNMDEKPNIYLLADLAGFDIPDNND
ncbi:hypothetical protein [Sutcliffiella horikoshii]|uniref:hypothetical protein n=1 Tax=Sutcliffiella horikoshii TaxID=79883 RepID=UPI003CEEC9B0